MCNATIDGLKYMIDTPIADYAREQEAIRFRKQAFALRPLLWFFRLFSVVLRRVTLYVVNVTHETYWMANGWCMHTDPNNRAIPKRSARAKAIQRPMLPQGIK